MLSRFTRLGQGTHTKLKRYFDVSRNFSNKKDFEKVLPPRIAFNVTGLEKFNQKKTWGEWIITNPGRSAVSKVVFGAAFGITALIWTAETILPSSVQVTYAEEVEKAAKKTVKEKISGELNDVIPPPDELVKLYGKLWDKAGLSEVESEFVEVFSTDLLDPVVIGTTHCREGASLGFPRYMMWTTPEEIDLNTLRVKPCWNYFFKGFRIPEDASAEDLEELKKNLILTNEEREFIVTLALRKANSYQSWFRIPIPGFIILFNYSLGFIINQKMNLFSQPRYMRLGVQALVWYICMGALILLHNHLKSSGESLPLLDVIRTSGEAEAAVEYFNKLINRNLILRKILGPDSHHYFQEDGEIVPSFYELGDLFTNQKMILLIQDIKERLMIIEAKRKELEENEGK